MFTGKCHLILVSVCQDVASGGYGRWGDDFMWREGERWVEMERGGREWGREGEERGLGRGIKSETLID